jgi:hypothetical protein
MDAALRLRSERRRCVSERRGCVSERRGCVSERRRCASERRCCVSERRCCVSERRCCASERRCCASERRRCASERRCCASERRCCASERRCVQQPLRLPDAAIRGDPHEPSWAYGPPVSSGCRREKERLSRSPDRMPEQGCGSNDFRIRDASRIGWSGLDRTSRSLGSPFSPGVYTAIVFRRSRMPMSESMVIHGWMPIPTSLADLPAPTGTTTLPARARPDPPAAREA